MSDAQEALEKTLSSARRDLEIEVQRSQEQILSHGDALKTREQTVEECLARAKTYYAKKEWARAFAEWDRVCAFLDGGDEFRKKVVSLKESHDNLTKVNRELAEIKGILNQRSSPSASDRKFVRDANEQTNGQIKNVYSYLSQQLRTERTPKTLSFWWPVLLALILLGVGYGSLTQYYGKARSEWKKASERTGQELNMELVAAQTERDELLKKTADLKKDYESKIEELKQQNAGWRNAGREKIDEMESRIRELETQNEQLTRRNETLIQDNLTKDRLIAESQSR